EADEDVHDLVLHARERVHAAGERPSSGQRQVDPVAGTLETALGLPRLPEPQLEQRLELTLDLVGDGAHPRALGGGQRAERAQEHGQACLPAEVADAKLLELGPRRRAGHRGARLVADSIDARGPHAAQPACAVTVPAGFAYPAVS